MADERPEVTVPVKYLEVQTGMSADEVDAWRADYNLRCALDQQFADYMVRQITAEMLRGTLCLT